MAGIHARCMDHGLGKTIRVDAQLVFEFQGHFEVKRSKKVKNQYLQNVCQI